MTSKRVLIGFGAMAGLYVALAISPLPRAIGRTNPAAASWFSPLAFNFREAYTTGNVLEFSIGMSREQLRDSLRANYSTYGQITVNCTVTTANSVVRIAVASESQLVNSSPRLCASLIPGRLAVQFDFVDNKVTMIKPSFVRNEGT